MRYTSKTVEKLTELYHQINLLSATNALLEWDLNVNLPPKGSAARAEQTAQLTGLITDRWQDKEFKSLLETAKSEKKLTDEEQAIVRNLERSSRYYYNVPKSIIVEFSKTTSEGFMAWNRAKQENDFSIFSPHLSKIVKLSQDIAEHLGYKDNPYDALLDLYEPDLTTNECKKMFTPLVKELKVLLKNIQNSKYYSEHSTLSGNDFYYSVKRQKQLSEYVLTKMGYDLAAGRLDISPHPFTIGFGTQDVRITTRYNRHDFRESLMASIHEGGHALYEQGVDEAYDGTPLSGGVSLGIHESQSRFWENQIGRSISFVEFMTPVYQSFFPEHLKHTDTDELVRFINHVTPSLNRVESDEVTYNMHIALRFEIEEQMINNKVKIKDLPEIWRQKMKSYLGIVPKTDSQGILQDVHWSYGSIGYFPTYTLGNLYSAQFTDTLRNEIDIDSNIKNGELGTILGWYRENVHKHGSRYLPNQLCTKVSGRVLSSKYLIDYLKSKYKTIYKL